MYPRLHPCATPFHARVGGWMKFPVGLCPVDSVARAAFEVLLVRKFERPSLVTSVGPSGRGLCDVVDVTTADLPSSDALPPSTRVLLVGPAFRRFAFAAACAVLGLSLRSPRLFRRLHLLFLLARLWRQLVCRLFQPCWPRLSDAPRSAWRFRASLRSRILVFRLVWGGGGQSGLCRP